MSTIAVVLGLAGFLLFTVGLLIGFAIPKLRNSRMALSAHLTACQTGPALTVFALFWPYLSVPKALATWIVGLMIASSYILVFGIALAAHFGASEALPIAGEDYQASRSRERLVTILVNGSGIVMGIVYLVVSGFALANIHTHL